MFKNPVAVMIAFAALTAFSASDQPSLAGWEGTGYRSGWLSYRVEALNGGFKLANSSQFVLSPRYSQPIRKLVLEVSCNNTAPTRILRVQPFVGGIESDDAGLAGELVAPKAKNTPEYVHFDWDAGDCVDAVRICLGGSGSAGEWSVSEIHVFYGGKDEGEDEAVRDLVKILPAPASVEIAGLTRTSLVATAAEVEYAAGYRFKVSRLVGDPRMEVREDFAAAPDVGGGWTIASENAKFDVYATDSYCDTVSSKDRSSLKIDKAGSVAEKVRVEILSPVLPVAAGECSFMYKVGATGKSDVFKVYGSNGKSGGWTELLAVIPETKSKSYAGVKLDREDGYRQLKFVFEADSDSFTVAAIDALAIVCGGDEEPVLAADSGPLERPEYSLSGLETGRYAVQVQALAEDGAEYGDSLWSEEAVADLAWADLVAGKPSDVKCETAAGKLRVSWAAAANAGYYLVSVATVGIPSETVVEAARTTETFIEFELPELGEYSVTVTACSPGGVTSASADAVVGELVLGAVGKVTAVAEDRETVSAKWPSVAMAEGYRVRVFRLGGEMLEFASDYSGLPEIWPEGWTHYAYIDKTYSGPVPKIDSRDSWIATCAYPLPVTKVGYSFKSHLDETLTAYGSIAVDVSSDEEGDVWSENFKVHGLAASRQSVSLEIPYSMGVRRIRFRFLYSDPDTRNHPLVEFGKVDVVCGERTLTEVASMRTDSPSAIVGGLPEDGSYVVEVTPLPSEGDGLSSVSEAVDLSLMKPRDIEPVLMSDFVQDGYRQDFGAFADVKSEVDVKDLEIPEWQFFKGDDEASVLKFSASGGGGGGGIYVLASGEGGVPRALGSVATGSYGCYFGVAFTNDLQTTVESLGLSFTAVQRSFKASAKSYVLEYLITDGECRIGTEGDWKKLEIPVTAPLTAETCGDATELRTAVGPVQIPGEIPAGRAILLRWRDETRTSSPLMGIDDVHFGFSARPRSLTLILR